MNFEALLETYKANPRRESAALLLTDAQLLAYVVIFKQCPPERRTGEDGYPMQPVEATWTALWDCVEVNVKTIALLADDELVKAQKMVERLKGLRLVFPDGTLQELATQIIVKRVKDALA